MPRLVSYSLLLTLLFAETRAFVVRDVRTLVSWVEARRLEPQKAAFLVDNFNHDDDEEEDEEDDNSPIDPYQSNALSEFEEKIELGDGQVVYGTPVSDVDWGGAIGALQRRVQDMESGKSSDPSYALFRYMSSASPNQAIESFVNRADPQVIQAMSGAVSSLLGGLSSPQMGTETIVKATGDKVASLCFQLQMTGYMFRNAEYLMALKDLLELKGSSTLQDYREAFDRIDIDGSGYIEAHEIAQLLDDVYEGKTPRFEVDAFLQFFDTNADGKVSWDEFEKGLGAAMKQDAPIKSKLNLLPGTVEPHEDDEDLSLGDPVVSGEVEITQKDGSIVKMDAKEYIEELRKEAAALKDALRREKYGMPPQSSDVDIMSGGLTSTNAVNEFGGIAGYIASRQGDVKTLTEKISPEIVETMKKLVDFVLEGGESAKGKDIPKDEMEMEIPGPALQQLALWQLVLGYQLREAEAKGDYYKLLGVRLLIVIWGVWLPWKARRSRTQRMAGSDDVGLRRGITVRALSALRSKYRREGILSVIQHI